MITRIYDNLDFHLKANRVLAILGPRRVGKTTLLKNYLSTTNLVYRLDTGDDLAVQHTLSSQSLTRLKTYVSKNELIAIDEAQQIPNIGINLKIIVDNIPNIKVVVTGSSSLDLRGQIGEPLVGRKFELMLYPVSQLEQLREQGAYGLEKNLPQTLIFGSYPEIITTEDQKEKIAILENITNSYLLKDILEFQQVKGSKVVFDLLKLISFQIGSEVSLTELGRELGLDYKTVARYLDLLEKSFILYNLRGYSQNLRKEVTRKSKYYFLDNGIRNAVISNFNSLDSRDDIGKLWENYLVSERLKAQSYKPIYANNYFWRTWEQQEVDWVEM